MGYESKIIVVDVKRHPDGIYTYADELARMDLSCVGETQIQGKTFTDLFTEPIDYKIRDPQSENSRLTDEDCYGEHIKSGDIHEIIEWLEEYQKIDPYRRMPPLIGMLKGYLDDCGDPWKELQVLHFGC